MPKKPFCSHTETFTKNDIISSLYNEIGYSKQYSAELVNYCFNTVKEQLMAGHNVKISSFGHFILRDKKQRVGRNPMTGEGMTIPSRRVITFRASTDLVDKVQQ